MRVYCRYCGTYFEVNSNEDTCPHCGSPINKEEYEKAKQKQAETDFDKEYREQQLESNAIAQKEFREHYQNTNKIIYIIIAVILLSPEIIMLILYGIPYIIQIIWFFINVNKG